MFATRVRIRRRSFATARSIAKLKPPLCSAENNLPIGVKIPFSTKYGEWVIYAEPMDVPVQSGMYDCGLFAIAFATALAQGKKPELFSLTNGTYVPHLQQCFEVGEMKMFPVLRKRRVKSLLSKKSQSTASAECLNYLEKSLLNGLTVKSGIT